MTEEMTSRGTPPEDFNEEHVRQFYRMLGHQKETELRPIDPHKREKKVASTFVHSEDEFVEACRRFNGRYNVYAGLNERLPGGTENSDVLKISNILLDLDYRRPKNTSSTPEQVEETRRVAEQLKSWLSDEYGIEPNFLFSGNGYQFILNIPAIPVQGNLAELREKLQAFNEDVALKFDHGSVEIDATHDPARICKVAGTVSIKGDVQRLAYPVNELKRRESDRLSLHVLTIRVPPKAKAEIRQVSPKDATQLERMFSADKTLKALYQGDWKDVANNKGKPFASRNEAEMALLVRLIAAELPKEQVFNLMSGCRIGKWQEAGQKYQDHQYRRALEFAASIVQDRLQNQLADSHDALVEAGATEKGGVITDVITNNYDFRMLARRVIAKRPLHYDRSKCWYRWNFEIRCWEMIDEVDILNEVDRALRWTGIVKTRYNILAALQMVARETEPRPKKSTWIQFANKAVDVATGEEFQATKEFFFTNPLPWNLSDSEETPTIDRIVTEWVGEENRQKIYEIMAYCMLPNYPIHRLFVFFGDGRNGKGRCHALITRLVGSRNVASTSLERLAQSRFEMANLYNKLVAFCGETNFNQLKDTAILKSLSGQDLMPAEFKGHTPFYFVNFAKLLISTNSLPVTLDKTEGFYSRVIVIDFPNKFDFGTDVLLTIPEEEFSNLCRKCVNILVRLLGNGRFTNEGSIAERAAKWEEKSNPLSLFIRNHCNVDYGLSVPFWQFYDAYAAFLKQNRYREQTKKEISQLLKNEGYTFVLRRHDTGRLDENGKLILKQWDTVLGIDLEPVPKKDSVTDVTNVTKVYSPNKDIYKDRSTVTSVTLVTEQTRTVSDTPIKYRSVKEAAELVSQWMDQREVDYMSLFSELKKHGFGDIEDVINQLLSRGVIFESHPGMVKCL